MALKYIYFNNIAEHVNLFQECIDIIRDTNPGAIGTSTRIGIANLIVYDTNNTSNMMPYDLYVSFDETYTLTEIIITIRENYYSIHYYVESDSWSISNTSIGGVEQYMRMVCDADNINTWVETTQLGRIYIYDMNYNFYRYQFNVASGLEDHFKTIIEALGESGITCKSGENTLKIANTGNFGNALTLLDELTQYIIEHSNIYSDSNNEFETIVMSTTISYMDNTYEYNYMSSNLLAYVKDNDTSKEIQCYAISNTNTSAGLTDSIRSMLYDMVERYNTSIKYFYFLEPYTTSIEVNGIAYDIHITSDLLNKWIMLSIEYSEIYNNVISIKEVPYSPDLLIISDCNNTEYRLDGHPEFGKSVPVNKYGQTYYNNIHTYINIFAEDENSLITTVNNIYNMYVELYNILGDMSNISSDNTEEDNNDTINPNTSIITEHTGLARNLLNNIAKKILTAEGSTETKIAGNELLTRLDGVIGSGGSSSTTGIDVLSYEVNEGLDSDLYLFYEFKPGHTYKITFDIATVLNTYPEYQDKINEIVNNTTATTRQATMELSLILCSGLNNTESMSSQYYQSVPTSLNTYVQRIRLYYDYASQYENSAMVDYNSNNYFYVNGNSYNQQTYASPVSTNYSFVDNVYELTFTLNSESFDAEYNYYNSETSTNETISIETKYIPSYICYIMPSLYTYIYDSSTDTNTSESIEIDYRACKCITIEEVGE